MSATVRPFLMFEGQAEEALRTWVSLVPGSEILEIHRYGAGGPAREGSVMRGIASIWLQQTLRVAVRPLRRLLAVEPAVGAPGARRGETIEDLAGLS